MKRFLAILTAGVAALGIASLTACNEGGTEAGGDKTVTLDDGSVYVGQVTDGVPNGYGTLTDAIGSEWKGNFVDGKLQGYGTYYGYDLVEYEGMFKDGLFDGLGHRIDSNGNDWKGAFVAGKAEGFGRIEWSTGCYYEGGWHNGNMHGIGWMTWPVGDAYFGEWTNGNPEGFGCKLFYDAAVASCKKGDYTTYNKYVGEMVNGFPEGKGIMYFQGSGGIYYGGWDKGDRDDDNAVYYFEPGINEVKFEGAFSKAKNAGWIWGEGTMWYSDGRVVTGVWEGTKCVEVISESTYDPSGAQTEAQAALDYVNQSENLNVLLSKLA